MKDALFPQLKKALSEESNGWKNILKKKENPPLNSALKLSLLIEGDFSAGQVSVIRSVRVYTPTLLKCEKVDTAAPPRGTLTTEYTLL